MGSMGYGQHLSMEVHMTDSVYIDRACLDHYPPPESEQASAANAHVLPMFPSGFKPWGRCGSAHIHGRIEAGDYENLRSIMRANRPALRDVRLVSGGGDVLEAAQIGRLLRKYLVSVNGPLAPWFDKTWRPGDIERVD